MAETTAEGARTPWFRETPTAEAVADLVGPDWMNAGDCHQYDNNPDLWFSEPGSTDENLAIEICKTCPVQKTCLRWAQDRAEPFGIWGGQQFEVPEPVDLCVRQLHELTDESVYTRPNGKRECLACRRSYRSELRKAS